jgi:hypothetical protein
MLSKEDELDLLSEEEDLLDPSTTKSIHKESLGKADEHSVLIPEGIVHKMSVTQKIEMERSPR